MNSTIPSTVDLNDLEKVTQTGFVSTIPPAYFPATSETLIISAEQENSTLPLFSDPNASKESLSFMLVPVLVILVVALFSGLAIHCIQKRQRLDNLRHTLLPLYTYNRDDDEWGVLLDASGRNSADLNNGRESRYLN